MNFYLGYVICTLEFPHQEFDTPSAQTGSDWSIAETTLFKALVVLPGKFEKADQLIQAGASVQQLHGEGRKTFCSHLMQDLTTMNIIYKIY